MLDRTDAGLRGALDCLWRICVRADIATESLCFFHGRSDLARRELQTVERIVGRRDAAGHHDLHLVASLTHLLADRLADLGVAVRSRHREGERMAATRSEERRVGKECRSR